jgi:hypothetical protein
MTVRQRGRREKHNNRGSAMGGGVPVGVSVEQIGAHE